MNEQPFQMSLSRFSVVGKKCPPPLLLKFARDQKVWRIQFEISYSIHEPVVFSLLLYNCGLTVWAVIRSRSFVRPPTINAI